MIFIALCFIIVGTTLSFLAVNYSILVILAGFLLLNIHTIHTLDFKQPQGFDFFSLGTILFFTAVAIAYVLGYSPAYWLLLLGILLQIIVAIWGVFRKK